MLSVIRRLMGRNMQSLAKIFRKLKFILHLITTTPRYKLIAFLQFMSGTASIMGLPMLVPILNYMEGSSSAVDSKGYLVYLENALRFIGLEPSFYTMLAVASFLILLGQCLIFVSSLLAANAQVELSKGYKEELFKAYGKVDWLWLVNNRSGEMNYSVLREADLAGVAHLNSQRVLIHSVQVFTLLFVTIKLSPALTLLAMAVYAVLGILGSLNSSCVYRLSADYNEKNKTLANDLNGFQQNKKFFKTSLLNERLINGIFTHIKAIAKNIKRQNVHIEMQYTFILMVTLLFLISVIFFYKLLALSYSSLLLILLIFLKMSPHFAALSTAYITLDSNIPVYLSLRRRLDDLHDNEERNASKQFKTFEPISFKDVSFCYPNGNRVFSNLNINIEPHKTTAFVGPSGVGKSTLLDLVLGLLNPDSGAIYYGNIPHDEIDKNSLRSKVAYVSQETTLIDGSMRQNLTIGTFDLSDEKIDKIIKEVGLDEVVRQMPQGLETRIGENGIMLSGGQRQRVALARALFMEPCILILDEATSFLDLESERLIQQTIKGFQKDFTIIVVTHKLSGVRFADKIYVLEEGTVCESGSYNELLEQKGKFYFLDSLQKSTVYDGTDNKI